MAFDITPYIGFGPIRFGMTVLEVQQAVPYPVKRFMKTVADDHATDAFDQIGLHVYYDNAGICEAVECFPPCGVTFHGMELLRIPFGELVDHTRALDPDLDVDETGFTSFLLGFGVFASAGLEEPEALPEGVIVFRQNYYGVSDLGPL